MAPEVVDGIILPCQRGRLLGITVEEDLGGGAPQ